MSWLGSEGADDTKANTARVAVTYSWALLAIPGHDPAVRSTLRTRAGRARRSAQRDTRLDPIWDPEPVRAKAFAAARAPGASFTVARAAAVVALKCSSALARHADVAAISSTLVAVDESRSPIPLPPISSSSSSILPVVGLLLTGGPDKVARSLGDYNKSTSFLVLADPDPASCPVRALLLYVSHPGFKTRSASCPYLVMSIRRRQGDYFQLSPDAISSVLKTALAACKVTYPGASAHARAAVANELLSKGLSEHAVCCLGRWAPGSSAFEIFYRKIDLARATSDAASAARNFRSVKDVTMLCASASRPTLGSDSDFSMASFLAAEAM